METLYLDESGRFEGTRAEVQTTFVGGFLTTDDPARVCDALVALRDDLRAAPRLAHVAAKLHEPRDLHATELRRSLDEGSLAEVRALVLRRLRGLAGFRFVSTHYFSDADVTVELAQDGRGANRFLRMWQTTVRNALNHQPWPGDGSLSVCTAQRSLPEEALKGGDLGPLLTYRRVELSKDEKTGLVTEGFRVASNEQIPTMLAGILGRGSAAPFARTLQGAWAGKSSGSIKAEDLESEPRYAGLLLADLACDLLREQLERAEGSGPRWPWFKIAYDPRWERYERLCEAAHESPRALRGLFELLEVTPADDAAYACVWRAAEDLLSSFVARARVDAKRPPHEQKARRALRGLLLGVARDELARKEGAFPRCERLLGSGGLDGPAALESSTVEEAILRLEYQNHTGRDVGAERDDLVRDVQALFARDLDAFFLHGEGLAHLAVSFQDEFDYDQAERVARVFLDRADPIAQGGVWTVYGRALSNLAQTLAYRQQPGDLPQAIELMRRARSHLREGVDLSQWGCHAGNLAALVGDDALLGDALDLLFKTRDVEALVHVLREARFGPGDMNTPLFSFSVLTRLALVGRGPLAEALSAALREPGCWARLFDNVRDAQASHPLELYARHLLELAPDDCAQEQAVLDVALRGFGNTERSRVADLLQSGAHAAHAARLFRLGRDDAARAAAGRAVETFLRPFDVSPYGSTTTYWEEMESGWFFDAVRALRETPSATTVEAYLERFRYEWR